MAKRTVETARTISVATPEELDKLIDFVNSSVPSGGATLEGEHLFAVERLVVSPSAGLFTPNSSTPAGSTIGVGAVIGTVGDNEVRSPFAGFIESFIALDGERVTAHQPIAWLRTN
jgi:[acyl-carrier-protein] S-malonyltransferase